MQQILILKPDGTIEKRNVCGNVIAVGIDDE